MSDADLHTLTGAYAADALDPDERAQFEAHLSACPACRQEVAELVATTARLASAAAEAPPVGLRERVLAEASRTRQVPPLSATQPVVASAPTRWRTQPATIAAAILLVVAAGLGVVAVLQQQRADRAEQRANRIAAVATDPDRIERSVAAAPAGTGTVVAAHDTAIFRATGLPALPADKTYQLWLISDSGATSAGLLGRGGRLGTVVEDIGGADALGLTVEPRSGSAAPTGQLVLQLELS